MDVRYTSDSSDGANNTYGLEIGDKDFDVMDSSDKTEQKDGHHKAGMKRKTTAVTGQSHRRSNQTPTKLSRYYKTFFFTLNVSYFYYLIST
jgi:hypothetical protein